MTSGPVESGRDLSAMLEAIRQVQARFIIEGSPRNSFGELLDSLLSITDSEYGFVGEVCREKDGTPFLRMLSISDIAWNEESRAMYDENTVAGGMELRNLDTLFGQVLVSRRAVIANDPVSDPRSGGLPPGHPVIRSFMGLPFFFGGKMVGMIGVANHPGAYTRELSDWLAPFLDACATLMVGYRNTREQVRVEQALQKSNNGYNAVLRAMPGLMFELDQTGKCLNFWGPREHSLFAEKNRLIGSNIKDLLPTETAQQVLATIGDAEQNRMSFGTQVLLPLPQGARWFELSVSKKSPEPGRPNAYLVLSRDITATRNKEEELRLAAASFESQQAILIADAKARILRVNNAFQEITGFESGEVIGRDMSMLNSDRHDEAFYDGMWSELRESGKWVGEVWDRRKDGAPYPKQMSITAIYDGRHEVSNYVAVFTDIAQRKQSEEEIHQLAFYDPLTRLPNRRLLVDRLQHAMEKSLRSGHHGALFFLDLDYFKDINDTKGHAIGDLLLIEVARRLKNCLRKGDTCARLSGDEFVLVQEGLSKTSREAVAQAKLIAQKVNDELSRPYLLEDYRCYSTPSIGITLFHGRQHSIDTLFRNADVAMYQAKAAGRNSTRFFDPQMQLALEARSSLEMDLRQALDRRQFTLHYQIQVDSQHRPLGAEVLLRWNYPARGLVLPDQFIGLSEEAGLIVQIGRWVLEAACGQLSKWQRNALTRELTLAVNISARQLHRPDFIGQVERVLTESGINPALLRLELAESVVLENIEDTIDKMAALKSLGVQFSLDDFGTGQSSLTYLKRLPLDQIKIDRSFVRDIATDPNDATIVNTIIAMSQAMGLEVIAEGVETDAQREFLDARGCQNFQGFLFSKPVPLDQFEEKVRHSAVA